MSAPIPPRSTCALLGVLLVLLAGGGCGGSTGPRLPTRSSAATHAIASADALCRRLNGELDTSSSGDLAKIAVITHKNASLEHRSFKELTKLQMPPELAPVWTKILVSRSILANELAKMSLAAKRGDVRAVSALAASKKRVHMALINSAVHAGFRQCASLG